MFDTPTLLSRENQGEFTLLPTNRTPHPLEHPESNAIIERFHEDLGKLCRIFNETPDKTVSRINTEKSKLLLHTHLKIKFHNSMNCVMFYETHQFSYNDLVWKHIPARRQADTYTGPH